MSTDEDSGKIIGDDYYQHLLDLTENSRPIITNLTEIASENVIYADQITKSIELRIKNCLPNYKLFALYLLDSICKNIGNPYNVLFGSKLYSIFSSVYSVVSDSIRGKMINLFKTWKDGRTMTGLPLFQQDQIDKIEQFLIKATSGNKIDKGFLIKDCQDLLNLIGRRMKIDILNQEKIQNKIAALNDLLNILMGTNPSQDELKYIMEHFKGVRIEETQILQRLEHERKRKEELQVRQEQDRQLLQQQQQLASEPKKELNLGFNLNDLSSFLQPKQQQQRQSNPTELLDLVLKLNIKIVKPNVNTSPEFLKFILNSVTVETKNIEEILSGYSKIDESFILENTPSKEDLSLLYDYKKFKCSVCGKRFANQKSMQPHLDWHFRNNNNLKIRSSKTIQSRNYYIDDSAFINFKEVEIIGYGDTEISKPKEMEKIASSKADAAEANKRHYVVITTDLMDTKCSICKEVIHGKYDDDINEWIWDNCIEVKQKQSSKIYHWTCYNDNYTTSTTSNTTSTNSANTMGLNFDLNMLKDIVNKNTIKKE